MNSNEQAPSPAVAFVQDGQAYYYDEDGNLVAFPDDDNNSQQQQQQQYDDHQRGESPSRFASRSIALDAGGGAAAMSPSGGGGGRRNNFQNQSPQRQQQHQQPQQQQQQWPVAQPVYFMHVAQPAPATAVCYICSSPRCPPELLEDEENRKRESQNNQISGADMFYPCNCPPCHRACFYAQRQKFITPKSYYSCSVCMRDYNIVRLNKEFDPDDQSEIAITTRLHWQLFILWVTIVLFLVGCVAAWGGFCYGVDSGHKNIPVGFRYITTSLAGGVPDANATKVWVEEFKSGEKSTFVYYMNAGILITAVMIILLAFCGCVYEKCCDGPEEEHSETYRAKRSEPCSRQCGCGGRSTCYCSWYYWSPHYGNNSCSGCNCCSESMCSEGCCCSDSCCDSACSTAFCQNCSMCSCNDGCELGSADCGKDAGPVVVVIVVVVCIAVLISAIFIICYYAISRISEAHAAWAAALRDRSAELNRQMVVVGRGEELRHGIRADAV